MIIDTPEKYQALQERRRDIRRRKSHYLCRRCGKYHHPNDTDKRSQQIGERVSPKHSNRTIDINDIFPN